jgi:hypothetical protein
MTPPSHFQLLNTKLESYSPQDRNQSNGAVPRSLLRRWAAHQQQLLHDDGIGSNRHSCQQPGAADVSLPRTFLRSHMLLLGTSKDFPPRGCCCCCASQSRLYLPLLDNNNNQSL